MEQMTDVRVYPGIFSRVRVQSYYLYGYCTLENKVTLVEYNSFNEYWQPIKKLDTEERYKCITCLMIAKIDCYEYAFDDWSFEDLDALFKLLFPEVSL